MTWGTLARTLTLFLMFSAVAHAEDDGLRRHALLVSANDGGTGRVTLRYAARDAEAIAKVLADLGGVEPADVVRIDGATSSSLAAGVAEIRRRVMRASSKGQRQEVLFYYSGHSDEDGLLLAGERVSYAKLRAMVGELPVDVRLMILDSCASGQLTLGKGGARRAPFLVDSSVRAHGQAVITSASADEAAQESERIQGSFFTHYFVSGLRGAADANGDGKVTLSEAYQYAYANTLARTQTTRSGPQHPSYDFQLAGTGDLVLTDLRTSPATLDFPKELDGQYFVRDTAGNLVAEIRKVPGRPVHLGLDHGVYVLTRGQGGKYAEATVDLSGHDTADAGALAFTPVEGEPAVARGAGLPKEYRQKSVSFQLVPSFADDTPEAAESHKFAFGLIGGRSGQISGMSLALGGYLVDEGGATGLMFALGGNWDRGALVGMQVGFLGNFAAGPVTGGQLGMVNWAAEPVLGGQFGILDWAPAGVTGAQLGAANWSDAPTKWAQIGLANWSGGPLLGAQVGMASVAKGDVTGAQLGYVNAALGHVTGAQVGVAAYAKDGIEGGQVAVASYAPTVMGAQFGAVNAAKEVKGAQVGGVDVARDVTAQVGFVNVAVKTAKIQFGVVNYAETVEDFSLGAVSYAGNGTLDFQTWVDELGFAHGTIRMGSKHLYTLYDYGDRTWNARSTVPAHRRQSAGVGLGGHATFGRVSVGMEAEASSIQDPHEKTERNPYGVVRLLAGFRVVSGLEVYGGPDAGYYERSLAEFHKYLGDTFHGRAEGDEARTSWLGYVVGLRWHFKT